MGAPGVDPAIAAHPAEGAKQSEHHRLHGTRRLDEPHQVLELASDQRELQQPGHPLGVGHAGIGQPEHVADHQPETRIQGRELDQDLGLILASVPPVMNRPGRGSRLLAGLRGALHAVNPGPEPVGDDLVTEWSDESSC